MQKLLIISFAFIMIYFNMGYYMQVSVQKEMARQEMKERFLNTIADSLLIVLDSSSIQQRAAWQEEGKEFWLNEELYDVVKRKVIKGHTYLYCLNDKNEENIIKNYIKSTKESSKNEGQKLPKSIFSVLFVQADQEQLMLPVVYKNTRFPSYPVAISQQHQKIFLPPPQA